MGINGFIIGQNLVPDMCIVDYGVNNKKYLFSNGVFDLQSAQVNGTFMKLEVTAAQTGFLKMALGMMTEFG